MTIRRQDPRLDPERDRDRQEESEGVWIRPYLGVDQGQVRELVARVLGEFGLELDPRGTDSDLLDVDGSYRRGGGDFWVVESSAGRIVGTCGVWPHASDRGLCELRKMYLDPVLRGRGMGRQLLELALDHARSAGFRRMELETNHAMEAAIALYESAGFTPLKADPEAPRCDRRFSLDLADAGDPGSGMDHRPAAP